jgi:uncharacterized protein
VHAMIASRLAEIEALCRGLGVRRLDLFGSAASDSFDLDTNDIEVLAEFEGPTDLAHFDFDRYFNLKVGLERLLQRPVDVLVSPSVDNPYVRERVMQPRETLYAA